MKRRELLKTIATSFLLSTEVHANSINRIKQKNEKKPKESLIELFSISVSVLKDYRDFNKFWGFFCFGCEISMEGKNFAEGFKNLFLSLDVEEKNNYFISLSNDIRNNEMKYLFELKQLMETSKLL